MEHTHSKEIPYGFPTIFGRGLLEEFKNFVNPPFLVVTMEDLWPMFGHHFEGAECQTYFCGSIEQDALNKEAENLGEVRAIVGLGGGQALDVAKYFSWRKNLPLFQAPTALSVNAVYGQRSGIRID
ncbi:MAG: iron-containing alcohol dehydrogenase, partial [bacterium]